MAIKMGKKQSVKNISLNIIAFCVQFVISFYISPLIVSKVGASAYGFIGLANDFVSYAAIIATVFNAVASRFIANAFFKEDYLTANRYFNSLIVSNFCIAGVLGTVSIILILNLQNILTIPTELIYDVKITFTLIFISYIITLVTMVFTTATFVTNRTDIQGIRNILQYFIRFAIIVIFLNFISVKIYWVALATLIAASIIAIINVNLTRKLTPEIRINVKLAKKEYAIELAKSGCWMALTSISTILLRGLDLTIANLMIGDYEMGLLSIARTMPNNVTSIIGTLAPIFTPVFISFYAKNNINLLVDNVKLSIKTMAVILFVPISAFIVFSFDFYKLWQRSLSEQELSIVTALSIMTIVQAYFNSTTSTLAQLSVVVNKLKMPVLISFGAGIISFIAEVLLIKFTSLGLYAIVLSTTVIMIIRYIVFNSFYAAWCLKQPLKCFLWDTAKTWLSIPVLILTFYFIRLIIPSSNWINLIYCLLISAIIGYTIMIAIYGRKEFLAVLHKILKRG